MTNGLFPDDGLRVSPPITDDLTAGERMRRRQAARISNGYHPLALETGTLRLHPDAPRITSREAGSRLGDYLQCGTCRFRQPVNGGNRDYPKCLFGREERPITDRMRAAYPTLYGSAKVVILTPRMSHGGATDVRAWWPACTDYQRVSTDPPDDTTG